jgi:hypothetical protein
MFEYENAASFGRRRFCLCAPFLFVRASAASIASFRHDRRSAWMPSEPPEKENGARRPPPHPLPALSLIESGQAEVHEAFTRGPIIRFRP